MSALFYCVLLHNEEDDEKEWRTLDGEIEEEDMYPEFSDVPSVEKICRPNYSKIRDRQRTKKNNHKKNNHKK